MTVEEVNKRLSAIASTIKLVCGVANNAAILVMLDAHDIIKQHPNYRQQVKQAYKKAFTEWHNYERDLLHAHTNRFFHVADMGERTRKKYGNISDQDYFEFWKGCGSKAYTDTRPLVTSLWNKYRLSLLHHGIEHADQLAWGMTASACLSIATHMYSEAVKDACNDISGSPEEIFKWRGIVKYVFKGFSLQRVLDAWNKALDITDKKATYYDLESLEEKNINHGCTQLIQAWSNPSLLYDSVIDSTEDYSEIFRTAGERKKAIREIEEVRQNTIIEDLKQ